METKKQPQSVTIITTAWLKQKSGYSYSMCYKIIRACRDALGLKNRPNFVTPHELSQTHDLPKEWFENA